MKKFPILLVLISAMMLLVSCSSNQQTIDYTDSYVADTALEYVMSEYNLGEILEMYEQRHHKTFQEDLLEYLMYRFEDRPNMAVILEEIDSQEMYSAYEQLFQIADEIGYYPSAIVGAHCLEKSTGVIHLTNSTCLTAIDFSDMYFICSTSEEDLINELEDDDIFLEGCFLCNECWVSDVP